MAEASSASVVEAAAGGEEVTRYSPEQVLNALNAIPEEERTFTATSLRSALQNQLAVLKACKAAKESGEATTLAELNSIIALFLKNVYDMASALPGTLAFDALEDLVARSGLLQPFVGGMRQADGTAVLVLGLPSKETLADTYEELIRIAGAAVVCYYHYTNFPGHVDAYPSDDATLLFSSLALASCRDKDTAEALEAKFVEAGAPITVAQIRWLMHFFRAQLSGLGAAIFYQLGDRTKFQEQLVAQQVDFLGLIKSVPENPAGYSYYVRGCLQFQQHSAAALFAQKGAVVAAAHHADFYRAQLDAQRAIALALAGGGASSTGAAAAGAIGAPSPGALAAVEAQQAGKDDGAAKEQAEGKDAEGAAGKGGKKGGKKAAAAAAAAVPLSLFQVGEVRKLLEGVKGGLEAERAQLPKVFEGLLSLDVIDAKVLSEKVEPLVATSSVPDAAELPCLSDYMYPTRAPHHLPRGAVSVGGEEEQEGAAEGAGAGVGAGAARANGGGARAGAGRGGKGGKGRGKK
ncbi:hypothetical protein HYH02_008605 [Chlamydomonas schloesseri]|uniref:Uncharacterized protein n=1 Tax=Chlamydomonas schloesseri TaxID=2026947 RepID=A0A835WD07_9CHLO|nr:hypothetical protein HYH02_008605 [Chlamydomonas schloesseri]|eukprot:KAG2445137.1 hypothetical protein HYH02_008605 [Chlamydomonas schloesseri]